MSKRWYSFTKITRTNAEVVLPDGTKSKEVLIYGFQGNEFFHQEPSHIERLDFCAKYNGQKGRIVMRLPKGSNDSSATFYFIPGVRGRLVKLTH